MSRPADETTGGAEPGSSKEPALSMRALTVRMPQIEIRVILKAHTGTRNDSYQHRRLLRCVPHSAELLSDPRGRVSLTGGNSAISCLSDEGVARALRISLYSLSRRLMRE